jgi:hypothetical protein
VSVEAKGRGLMGDRSEPEDVPLCAFSPRRRTKNLLLNLYECAKTW